MFRGRLRYYALRAYRSIWFRPAVYAVLAVLALAVTPVVQPLVPESLVFGLDAGTVDRVLDILAKSMLAVAIFSLSTLVTQLNAAAQSATPRTRPLLSQDRTAQNAISTFIGTFLFAVLGIIGLELDLYDATGRFVVFVLSLLLIALVIVNLVLWIRRISAFGGVGEAIQRVEDAAGRAFAELAREPWFGGGPAADDTAGAHAVHADAMGYVQSIDARLLGELSERLETTVHVRAVPGDFIAAGRPLVLLGRAPDDQAVEDVRGAYVIGRERDFASDPRYGVLVLSEIASRALSPGINDPGTAIDVIGAQVRVLTRWRERVAQARAQAEPEARWPRLRVPRLDPGDVLAQAFRGIVRDGAGMAEVGVRLQQAFTTLATVDPDAFGDAADWLARAQLERGRRALTLDDDVRRLERARAGRTDQRTVGSDDEPATKDAGTG